MSMRVGGHIRTLLRIYVYGSIYTHLATVRASGFFVLTYK